MIESEVYLGVLRRRWWVPLFVLLVCVGVALVLTLREEQVFASTASLVVVPSGAMEDPGDVIRSLDTLDRRSILVTLSEIPETRESRQAAQGNLGWEDGERRRYSVRASVPSSSNLVRIRVEGPDPQGAASFANALARVTREAGRGLYPIFDVRHLEEAVPRSRPVRPDLRRSLTVGVVLGLLLGFLAAYAMEALLPARPDA